MLKIVLVYSLFVFVFHSSSLLLFRMVNLFELSFMSVNKVVLVFYDSFILLLFYCSRKCYIVLCLCYRDFVWFSLLFSSLYIVEVIESILL